MIFAQFSANSIGCLIVLNKRWEALRVGPTSHTSAHESVTTVAPFRAWRGLRLIVAREPVGTHSERARIIANFLTNENPLADYIFCLKIKQFVKTAASFYQVTTRLIRQTRQQSSRNALKISGLNHLLSHLSDNAKQYNECDHEFKI